MGIPITTLLFPIHPQSPKEAFARFGLEDDDDVDDENQIWAIKCPPSTPLADSEVDRLGYR